MTEPKVEIKNYHSGYSREWGPDGRFDLDLWINGVKCMKVIEEGNGGEMDFEPFTHNNPKADLIKANIALLEAHIKSLPKIKSSIDEHEFPMDMGMFIEELINKQKREKDYAKGICFGKPDAHSFQMVSWKGKKLAQIDKISLQRAIDDVRREHLKAGEVILNTNFAELGVK
jgi:O-succinylbenzoate synthase